MEHKGSLPHSHVLATCPYPEPARFSPYPHILISQDFPFRCISPYQSFSPGPRRL